MAQMSVQGAFNAVAAELDALSLSIGAGSNAVASRWKWNYDLYPEDMVRPWFGSAPYTIKDIEAAAFPPEPEDNTDPHWFVSPNGGHFEIPDPQFVVGCLVRISRTPPSDLMDYAWCVVTRIEYSGPAIASIQLMRLESDYIDQSDFLKTLGFTYDPADADAPHWEVPAGKAVGSGGSGASPGGDGVPLSCLHTLSGGDYRAEDKSLFFDRLGNIILPIGESGGYIEYKVLFKQVNSGSITVNWR